MQRAIRTALLAAIRNLCLYYYNIKEKNKGSKGDRVTHIGVGGGWGGARIWPGGKVRCNRTLDSPLGHYPSKGLAKRN